MSLDTKKAIVDQVNAGNTSLSGIAEALNMKIPSIRGYLLGIRKDYPNLTTTNDIISLGAVKFAYTAAPAVIEEVKEIVAPAILEEVREEAIAAGNEVIGIASSDLIEPISTELVVELPERSPEILPPVVATEVVVGAAQETGIAISVKPRGRKVNTDSTRQRAFALIRTMLTQETPARRCDITAALSEQLGLKSEHAGIYIQKIRDELGLSNKAAKA